MFKPAHALAAAAFVLTSGMASASEVEDLGPLLDGFLEGCAFSDELAIIYQALPNAARSGEMADLPTAYKSIAGKPYVHQGEDEYTHWRLPLIGHWRGALVSGLELIGIDETGVYVAMVHFADGPDLVGETFGDLLHRSQGILMQDDFAADFGHSTSTSVENGFASVYCDLSS